MDLERDILRTVAWFSLFSYPVTSFEIWKWMSERSGAWKMCEVMDALERSPILQTRLRCNDGLYMLTDADIASVRRERHADAIEKFRRLDRVVGYLRRLPWVEGVAACNTLAWRHTRRASDLDLFIIVRGGCLWLTRLLAVFPFFLLRRRPGETQDAPICFSFFLSDAVLSLDAIRLPDGDPYLTSWIASLVPLFDRHGVFPKFWRANGIPSSGIVEDIGSVARLRSRLDRLAERIERHFLPAKIREMANKDSRVVLSNHMLKFHVDDRRADYRAAYKTLCASLI